MRDKNVDWEDSYDYSPNELAELSQRNPDKYRQVVQSNLQEGDTVRHWEQRNLEWAQECIRQQECRCHK
jgi:hypothetical protein